jgi:acetoacetyl-CoA reductase
LKGDGRRVVAIYARGDEAASALEAELGVTVVKCDVADFARCEEAVTQIEATYGPIDILVNNAGVTRDAALHKMTCEQWDEVLKVDLYSVFNLSRLVIGGMRDRGFGRIVNISSINGQKGQFGQTNYCAAKAGMVGFTKALALENARKGVTVNAVAPGYIDTDMVAAVPAEVLETIKAAIPIGRLGAPEEVARCVAFLTSDDAGLITGATLAANGGQYMLG